MQARDRVLIDQATEIRLRAERRVGQLLADMEKNPGARGSGSNQHELRSHDATTPKLSDLGINKSQSSRWQKLADLPEDAFETVLNKLQHKATDAVDRAQQPKPKSKPKPKPKPEQKRKGNGGSAGVIAACIAEVKASVSAAAAKLDEAEIIQLLGDLRDAIGKAGIEAISRKSEKDRWTETNH
jgi:hypothetical protein